MREIWSLSTERSWSVIELIVTKAKVQAAVSMDAVVLRR